MKQYTHAWLALKSVELLKSYSGRFSKERNNILKRFLEFISSNSDTFVRGAWFPDTIISDNVEGGHTWKYYLDQVNGRKISNRPPSHNSCLQFVKQDLDQKVSLDTKTSDLPDRCEALSQTIRDMILITNKLTGGDVLVFNNSQTGIFFLMLAHYICDAHVPFHCDKRDFYSPSKMHPDLEGLWEDEILRYYKVSKKRERFDLDEDYNLQLDKNATGYNHSILYECDKLVKQITWDKMNNIYKDWRDFLGNNNKNFWDYLVAVCLVSFHMSLKMFPLNPPQGANYINVRINHTSPFKEDVIKYSPYILADAIHSVALLWLATWERWELLKKGVR